MRICSEMCPFFVAQSTKPAHTGLRRPFKDRLLAPFLTAAEDVSVPLPGLHGP